jgi:hypothetical protein
MKIYTVLIECQRESRDDDFNFVTTIYGTVNDATIKQAIDDHRDDSDEDSIWDELQNYGRVKYTIIREEIKEQK